jgi:hypothetical protein
LPNPHPQIGNTETRKTVCKTSTQDRIGLKLLLTTKHLHEDKFRFFILWPRQCQIHTV